MWISKKTFDAARVEAAGIGWLACEQVFIYEARAKAYEERGNLEEAAWQRKQAAAIRAKHEPAF